ncbi:MAG: pyridoxamine kinase [Wujia sp.]
MKRILSIQDISCLGKCSLTVALPIISAMGVECCILPTAVLSTHTMFSGFTFKDLTDQIEPITSHWKEAEIGFDALYTGYLGSLEQIDLVMHIFDEFGNDGNQIVVDPVIGDNGKIYPALNIEFANGMKKLCSKADIILPNLTEASLMTGREYRSQYDEAYVKDMLKALAELGARVNILTGISLSEDKMGIMGYDREKNTFFQYYNRRYPMLCHGTGDIYASTCVGALMNDKSVEESAAIAVDYIAEIIRLTAEDPAHRTYGVNFESAIPYLLQRLKQPV